MTERDRIIVELRSHGATLKVIGERFHLSVAEVRAVLAEEPRVKGRPCPACRGTSVVLKVWDEPEGGIRLRECRRCQKQWRTIEVELPDAPAKDRRKAHGDQPAVAFCR